MPMPPNYPLRFEPILKERIWGGRRLETVLGKKLPPIKLIGESWEISDHGADTSVVSHGQLRGARLRDLMVEFPESFGGLIASRRPLASLSSTQQFPLLVKWIDANAHLSVQVHPPDGHPLLPPGEAGKTECWLVLHARPGSEVFLGLRRGIDRAALVHELARGSADRCLNAFPARAGDFLFVPAGTVHAIGAGVLLAEIQQSSDTTFRLFDWNRTDLATGQPRELQVEHALESLDFDLVSPPPVNVGDTPASSNCVPLLVPDQCPHFVVTWRRVLTSDSIGEIDRCHVLVCLNGSGQVSGGGEQIPARPGDCLLLPAGGEFTCQASKPLEILDAWVP